MFFKKTARRFRIDASHPTTGCFEVYLERNRLQEFNLFVGDIVEVEAVIIFFKNSRKKPKLSILPFPKSRIIKKDIF